MNFKSFVAPPKPKLKPVIKPEPEAMKPVKYIANDRPANHIKERNEEKDKLIISNKGNLVFNKNRTLTSAIGGRKLKFPSKSILDDLLNKPPVDIKEERVVILYDKQKEDNDITLNGATHLYTFRN